MDLSLYVQYDRHVQQAVDEHIHTRCVLSQPNSVASESAASSTEAPSSKTAVTDEEKVQRNSVLLSAVEKIARRSESHDNNKNLLVTARPVTSAPLSFKSAPAILHGRLVVSLFLARKKFFFWLNGSAAVSRPEDNCRNCFRILPSEREILISALACHVLLITTIVAFWFLLLGRVAC